MTRHQPIPGVVFQPHSHQGLQRGINQLVDAVRPTLGPCSRAVVVEHTLRTNAPEFLHSAGVISRRIVQLPDRDADMGAMFVRHVLWRVQEEIGDGTATAAVLFQAVYNRGLQYIAAGGNAMQLRRYLERGLREILAELDDLTMPIHGNASLTQLAESLCFDQALAPLLGEIFGIIGQDGQLDIRKAHGRTLDRQYVEGMHWPSSVFSPQMFTDQNRLRADLANAAILISDLALDDPRHLVPLIEMAVTQQVRTLLIIADKLSDPVVSLLLSANRDPERFQIIAVHTPGAGTVEQAEVLEDLAMVCGGRPLVTAAGDTLRGLEVADFGHARRAWCDRSFLGIIGGQGDARAFRRHVTRLRTAYTAADDANMRVKLQQRIGRLLGGAAILLTGGSTDSEITVREDLARKTVSLLRAALREGVLPGGGLALLACQRRLRRLLEASANSDEQFAYRILIRALEEPIRTIAANAGYEASTVVAQVNRAELGFGFDARSGQLVDMVQAGIFDVATAQKAAIRGAIAGATTALTVDTLIHKRNPESVAGHP